MGKHRRAAHRSGRGVGVGAEVQFLIHQGHRAQTVRGYVSEMLQDGRAEVVYSRDGVPAATERFVRPYEQGTPQAG